MLHNRSQTYQSPLKPLRRVPQVSIDPPRLARMLCFEAVDRVGVVLRLRIWFFFLHFPPPRTLPPLPPRRCGESGFIIELALS